MGCGYLNDERWVDVAERGAIAECVGMKRTLAVFGRVPTGHIVSGNVGATTIARDM